jgi:hypothetical protein
MNELSINMNGDQKEVTITHLEGKALELKHPVAIAINGNIQAVSAFLEKRYAGSNFGKKLQAVDRELAIVIVNDDAMTIDLFLDKQDCYGTHIKASLEESSELKGFGITNEHKFSKAELVKFLRQNRRFFHSKDVYDTVLKGYMMLDMSVVTSIKNNNDLRGNVDIEFKKHVIAQNIPESFDLKIPIFKGQREEVFRVDICFDVSEATPRFWFESVELHERRMIRQKEIFAKELESCKDFVIIHQ